MTIHLTPRHLNRKPGSTSRRLGASRCGVVQRSATWPPRTDWAIDGEPILSEKDATAPLLRDAEVFS